MIRRMAVIGFLLALTSVSVKAESKKTIASPSAGIAFVSQIVGGDEYPEISRNQTRPGPGRIRPMACAQCLLDSTCEGGLGCVGATIPTSCRRDTNGSRCLTDCSSGC